MAGTSGFVHLIPASIPAKEERWNWLFQFRGGNPPRFQEMQVVLCRGNRTFQRIRLIAACRSCGPDDRDFGHNRHRVQQG